MVLIESVDRIKKQKGYWVQKYISYCQPDFSQSLKVLYSPRIMKVDPPFTKLLISTYDAIMRLDYEVYVS
ncbi:hypothetical protein VNO77_12616 [Canavalia gladiata]|uniref:Uncharacterized protein n=1 Tax=Canavalia gladiata TaxID=3824 RepID=A0AAN9QPU3_CANGL